MLKNLQMLNCMEKNRVLLLRQAKKVQKIQQKIYYLLT